MVSATKRVGSPTAVTSEIGPRVASRRSSTWGPRSSSAPRATRHGVAKNSPGREPPLTKLICAACGSVCATRARKSRPSAVKRLVRNSSVLTPASSTAATSRSASGRSKANGFSSSRCLPASPPASPVPPGRPGDGEGDRIATLEQLLERARHDGAVRARQLGGGVLATCPHDLEAGAGPSGDHRRVHDRGPRPSPDQAHPHVLSHRPIIAQVPRVGWLRVRAKTP